MTRDWLTQVVRFVLLVLMQVLLVRRLVLFDTGFCFVYIGFILFLPIQLARPWVLLLGFVTGFTMDLFYDTGGLHAAASVLLAFVRGAQLRLIRPRDGYDVQDTVNGHRMGWDWWALAVVPLVLIHHTAIFWIELSRTVPDLATFARIFVSTVFTSLTLLILQLLIWEPKAR
jgi:hypothetical protein